LPSQKNAQKMLWGPSQTTGNTNAPKMLATSQLDSGVLQKPSENNIKMLQTWSWLRSAQGNAKQMLKQ
jgi:hypothetical protein